MRAQTCLSGEIIVDNFRAGQNVIGVDVMM